MIKTCTYYKIISTILNFIIIIIKKTVTSQMHTPTKGNMQMQGRKMVLKIIILRIR